MAKILVELAIMSLITCYWLESANANRTLRIGDNMRDSRTPRNARVTGFIELTNFRRPFLIVQTDIIPETCEPHCPGEEIRTKLAESESLSYPGLDSTKCDGWLEDCLYLSGVYGATGTYCISDGNVIWARDSYTNEYGEGKDGCSMNVPTPEKKSDFYCHTCLCMCTERTHDDGPDSNWAFSLKPQISDISQHKFIVGVRFRVKNKLIYLEVKERSFDSHDEGEWKGLDEVSSLVRDVDYSPLEPKSRSIQLDDINVPSNHVVTGVRFTKQPTTLKGQQKVLRIEVRGSEIDTNGKIKTSSSSWYNSESADTNESRLIIFEDIGFTNKTALHIMPYLATNDILSDDNSPLSGVGLTKHTDDDSYSLTPKISPSGITITVAVTAETSTTVTSTTTKKPTAGTTPVGTMTSTTTKKPTTGTTPVGTMTATITKKPTTKEVLAVMEELFRRQRAKPRPKKRPSSGLALRVSRWLMLFAVICTAFAHFKI